MSVREMQRYETAMHTTEEGEGPTDHPSSSTTGRGQPRHQGCPDVAVPLPSTYHNDMEDSYEQIRVHIRIQFWK